MSKATELIERAKKRFEELGYKVNKPSRAGRLNPAEGFYR